jgi:F-type H+-transporting ATPase subunit a
MLIVSLIYGMAPYFIRFGLPLIAHGFFDLFAGAIQTYVFVAVSVSIIGVLSQPSEA